MGLGCSTAPARNSRRTSSSAGPTSISMQRPGLACSSGVKELVEGDPALVHARGGDGQTPLHFASSVEIAGYLLDHGAEIDARDVDHESTAAQYMVGDWPRRSEVARYLIARGAQPDILMAAALGDLELVRSFLDENPASVWVSVAEKYFPKQNPNSGGHIYIFSFGWSKTAHMLAHEFGHQEVFRLLMQRSSLALRFAQACDAGEEALANEVLKKHPDVIRTMPGQSRPSHPRSSVSKKHASGGDDGQRRLAYRCVW